MLLNYVELDALLKWGVPSRAAEEEIFTLHAVQDKLSSELETKKANVKSLEEAVEKAKRDSFNEGFNVGCSKGFEAYLASPVF